MITHKSETDITITVDELAKITKLAKTTIRADIENWRFAKFKRYNRGSRLPELLFNLEFCTEFCKFNVEKMKLEKRAIAYNNFRNYAKRKLKELGKQLWLQI